MIKTFRHGPRITNELGLLQTVPDGCEHFSFWGRGKHILLLGLGPSPQFALQNLLEQCEIKEIAGRNISYLEATGFESQAGQNWKDEIPDSWKKLTLEEFSRLPLDEFSLSFYKPGLRLFPSFYGPLRAKIQALSLKPAFSACKNSLTAMVAGDETGLLITEICEALRDLNFQVVRINPEEIARSLPQIIKKCPPDLFLSVNLAGFDPLGEIYYLLNELDIPCASWLVDNPWHILSGLRASFWKEMHLFVTDASFIPQLESTGAKSAHHLPLAANPKAFQPKQDKADLDIVFAGRSEFPNRNNFFAAAKIPQDLLEEAKKSTLAGNVRDFNWWLEKLEITGFWPGQEVRKAGFGAETCSLAWRAECIRAALLAGHSFKLFGNKEWLDHIPELGERLKPPLDYYHGLPAAYASARIVLSTTSLLLPEGLNQRHFDAWMAGSICLTDNTPGLKIFPPEIALATAYSRPDDIAHLCRELLNHSSLRAELTSAWSALLLNEHTYRHRMELMLKAVGLQKAS